METLSMDSKKRARPTITRSFTCQEEYGNPLDAGNNVRCGDATHYRLSCCRHQFPLDQFGLSKSNLRHSLYPPATIGRSKISPSSLRTVSRPFKCSIVWPFAITRACGTRRSVPGWKNWGEQRLTPSLPHGGKKVARHPLAAISPKATTKRTGWAVPWGQIFILDLRHRRAPSASPPLLPCGRELCKKKNKIEDNRKLLTKKSQGIPIGYRAFLQEVTGCALSSLVVTLTGERETETIL